MSAARARRAASRGYTLIEVMAALGVLAIGATGVLALQKATLISNTNARNLAIANSIAMTWAERLRVDALQWNQPLTDPNTDLGTDTAWLALSTTAPFTTVTPTEIIALGSPSADVLGADIYPGDTSASAFCTHVRFRQFTDPVSGTRIWDSLIRAEIRVVWERSGNPINCTIITPFDVDTDPGRFGAVYLTTGVLRNTSER
ncbi:type IV pilus modification PilV family protein [Sorangium sp. So ce128]|uniref:type IV pilus modification PilV family protein n=1 Tax=Sorangium sp. So ce128 TaxID=3133281 RepID=UPI003F6240FF